MAVNREVPAVANGDASSETNESTSSVQAVGRALDILDMLATGDKGVGEVARSLGVNKSTASRLLSTMHSRGFVGKNRLTGAHRLGAHIARLYQAYVENLRPGREAAVLVDRLAQESGETVLLTVFQGDKATYIDKVDSRQPLRTSSRIGDEAPLHCGAAGKSILAFLPDSEKRALLGAARLKRFTSRTIGDRQALFRELDRIRNQGYAISDEEINEGVIGIGVPLLDWRSMPVGALSITAPKSRLTDDRLRELIELLRRAGDEWREAIAG